MFSFAAQNKELIASRAEERQDLPRALSFATWKMALLLLLASLILRLIYLIWFCPYQLLGDESYYWEQSRHLDWCYNEKGPVLAWLIAACCHVFGNNECAVRLPVTIASLIAAWGIGKIAISISDGDQRVGFFAVVLFMLIPAFQANAIICTQDGILIALWVGLTAVGLRLVRRWQSGASTWVEWILLWIALGFGLLLKQSILIFLSSIFCYVWFQRRNLPRLSSLFWQLIFGGIIVALFATPMIAWNARHGWPMLAHTLGHLGAGGDQINTVNHGTRARWILNLIAAVMGATGPALVLMVWASRQGPTQDQRSRDQLWMACAAWPSVVFFVLLAFRKPVVPSWPLPSLVPLVALAAQLLVAKFEKFKLLWLATLAYGSGSCLLIAFPIFLTHLPIFGARIQHSLVRRFTGHREDASELQRILATIHTPDGQPPIIVARHYMQAGLYSFYLPGHPTVCTAGKYLGKRSTTFDQWQDTNLENPTYLGRTLLLDGEGDLMWEQGLLFDRKEPIDGDRFFLAYNYRGPQPDHPRQISDE